MAKLQKVINQMMPKIRTYNELIRLKTFEERFKYLQLNGQVGSSTFGFDRYLNQMFYNSRLWLRTRDLVIIRDNGCDLGMLGYEIGDRIIIHHMNPIEIKDIVHGNRDILDPEFLICVSNNTHQAIHYGDESLLPKLPVVRFKNDTAPWKRR